MNVNRPWTRRQFVQTAALGAALGTAAIAAGAPGALIRARKPLRILVLGGTGFLGPAVIDAALARGHTVTLFNRGKTEKRKGEMYPNCEKLLGNRDPKLRADDADPNSPLGLSQLEGKQWDAAVDTSGYVPRIVKASAELLAPNIKHYTFISSISAYAKNDVVNADETSALATMADPTVEEMGADFSNYGPLKVLCEQAAEAAMPGRVANTRPGYIVGVGDSTDRFTYWPARMQRGGEVLAPGDPNDPIQVIDVKDLGEFVVTCIENNITGVYNAVGPVPAVTWGQTLDACVAAAKSDAKLTWVPADFLESNGLPPGSLPIWIPPVGEYKGFHTYSNAKAVQAGLKCRPILETCQATLAWLPTELERRERVTKQMMEQADKDGKPRPQMGDPKVLRAALDPETEKKVLAAWHAKK